MKRNPLPSPARRPVLSLRRQLALLLAMVLGVFWLAVAWDYRKSEDEALARMYQQTGALALAFSENAESTFLHADHVLLELRDAWLTRPRAFADAIARHQGLMAQTAIQVGVIDADGYLAYSNLAPVKARTYLGDREHFTVHRERGGDRLFASRPIRGRISGKWSIQLTRPIFHQGRFAGVIVLSLDPGYFVRIYQRIALGAQGRAVMVRDSGEIMARSLGLEDNMGKSVAPAYDSGPGAPLYGAYRRAGKVDGVERINGYYRIPALGLAVIVGFGVEEQLAPVRAQQRVMLAIAAAVTLLLLLMAWQMLRAMTRRDQAEAAIADSEERLQLVIKGTNDGIWDWNLERDTFYLSPKWKQILGYADDELPNARASFERNLHPDDRARVLAFVDDYLAGKVAVFAQEFRMRHKDGSWSSILSRAEALRDAGGKPCRITGSHADLTERKQAEARLQLAASVFTHAREGIMITDAAGTIVEVNGSFSRITGYSREEAVGRNPRILKSGRQPAEYYAAMWQTLTESGNWYGEAWNRRKDGEVYAEMITISAVRDAGGATRNYVALFTDITHMKAHQRQLERIAHYDALTGLPNRVLLADRLRQAIAQSQRRGRSLALVYLDLDGFKAVNDRHGHEVGDALLIALARRMKDTLREGDTMARIGGDEFVAVLADLDRPQDCETALARLLRAAAEPVALGATELRVSASIGVALYPRDGADSDLLMRHADQAMYQAKQGGKNRYHLFDASQEEAARTQREQLEQIRCALDRREFELYYQPKVNMRSGAVIGAEALIRWRHPLRGLLLPAAFLPAIEGHALSVELGEWVIDSALAQMAAWQAAGHPFPVSVNIGGHQLRRDDFVTRLAALLAAHPEVRPCSLELEIRETSALEDVAQAAETIRACRALGVRFALDDFGTGYSSLSYLKRLLVELLKIDQSFVRGMLDDPDDRAIVESVVALAATFHREVMAEGVASVEHGELLLSLGCELAQGYGIARPMPAAELPGWAGTWRPNPAWTTRPGPAPAAPA